MKVENRYRIEICKEDNLYIEEGEIGETTGNFDKSNGTKTIGIMFRGKEYFLMEEEFDEIYDGTKIYY